MGSRAQTPAHLEFLRLAFPRDKTRVFPQSPFGIRFPCVSAHGLAPDGCGVALGDNESGLKLIMVMGIVYSEHTKYTKSH